MIAAVRFEFIGRESRPSIRASNAKSRVVVRSKCDMRVVDLQLAENPRTLDMGARQVGQVVPSSSPLAAFNDRANDVLEWPVHVENVDTPAIRDGAIKNLSRTLQIAELVIEHEIRYPLSQSDPSIALFFLSPHRQR
jgi:hypothetical protein